MNNTEASKHINYTKEEIQNYLDGFKESVKRSKYYICFNRDKNKNFVSKYNINSQKQKSMLLEVEVEDFCYSVDNEKDLNEQLYIFSRDYVLNYWGIDENVPVYIKTVVKQQEFSVIISFHEREKNIKKLFG